MAVNTMEVTWDMFRENKFRGYYSVLRHWFVKIATIGVKSRVVGCFLFYLNLTFE